MCACSLSLQRSGVIEQRKGGGGGTGPDRSLLNLSSLFGKTGTSSGTTAKYSVSPVTTSGTLISYFRLTRRWFIEISPLRNLSRSIPASTASCPPKTASSSYHHNPSSLFFSFLRIWHETKRFFWVNQTKKKVVGSVVVFVRSCQVAHGTIKTSYSR